MLFTSYNALVPSFYSIFISKQRHSTSSFMPNYTSCQVVDSFVPIASFLFSSVSLSHFGSCFNLFPLSLLTFISPALGRRKKRSLSFHVIWIARLKWPLTSCSSFSDPFLISSLSLSLSIIQGVSFPPLMILSFSPLPLSPPFFFFQCLYLFAYKYKWFMLARVMLSSFSLFHQVLSSIFSFLCI